MKLAAPTAANGMRSARVPDRNNETIIVPQPTNWAPLIDVEEGPTLPTASKTAASAKRIATTRVISDPPEFDGSDSRAYEDSKNTVNDALTKAKTKPIIRPNKGSHREGPTACGTRHTTHMTTAVSPKNTNAETSAAISRLLSFASDWCLL